MQEIILLLSVIVTDEEEGNKVPAIGGICEKGGAAF